MTLKIVQEQEAAPGLVLPAKVQVSLEQLTGDVHASLLALSVSAGLAVIDAIMQEEIAEACGPKGKHDPARAAVRHASERSSLKIAGQRVEVTKPRMRSADGAREIPLASWSYFSSAGAMDTALYERMLSGVSTRRYERCVEPIGQPKRGVSKSAIGRHFKERCEQALGELMSRELTDLDIAVLMIDGIEIRGEMVVCAIGITGGDAKKCGVKVPLGLWHGSTENHTVVAHLASDLAGRGLDLTGGALVVIDGSKALAKGLRKVFGDSFLIQRCQLHKERNVLGHLPKIEQPMLKTRLRRAWAMPTAEAALVALRIIASQLETLYPGAAASLREGMDDTVTVNRLGLVDTKLWKTLHTTNPIESMMDIVRTRSRNVKNWQGGAMRQRWIAAGLLDAERSFNRVRGHAQIPHLQRQLKKRLTLADNTHAQDHAA